jgi:hypothetical protein
VISIRLLALIVMLVFVSLLGTGIAVYRKAAEELIHVEEDKFLALMQVRRGRLEEYLDSIREETRFWARSRIMQATAGMGGTGEPYVVGGDLLMRSDSRFSEEFTTLKTAVDTETVRLALFARRSDRPVRG